MSEASRRRTLQTISTFRPAFRVRSVSYMASDIAGRRVIADRSRPHLRRGGLRAATARLRPRLQHDGHPGVPCVRSCPTALTCSLAADGRDRQVQRRVRDARWCLARSATRRAHRHLRAHDRAIGGGLLVSLRRLVLGRRPQGRPDHLHARVAVGASATVRLPGVSRADRLSCAFSFTIRRDNHGVPVRSSLDPRLCTPRASHERARLFVSA